MKIIELKDRTIYRADKGKKVKFIDNENKFAEIVVKNKTNRIVEVDE